MPPKPFLGHKASEIGNETEGIDPNIMLVGDQADYQIQRRTS
jgi:hypothetical protein